MTTVLVSGTAKLLDIKIQGHSSHDVCVALSALTNALVQFTEDYRDRNVTFTADILKYESGAVDIRVMFGGAANVINYLQGIEAVLTGFKLYEANFPGEVKYVDAKVIGDIL